MASQKIHHVAIQPKGIHYHGDGTGRDGYILKINGGLFSSQYQNSQKKISKPDFEKFHFGNRATRPKYPSKSLTINHYIPDGSGRDGYIKVNEGGGAINYNIKRREESAFINNLRGGSTSSSKASSSFYSTGTFGLKTKSTLKNREKFFQQTQDSWRLSQNKQILKPPQRNFTPRLTLSSLKKNFELTQRQSYQQYQDLQQDDKLDEYALYQNRRRSYNHSNSQGFYNFQHKNSNNNNLAKSKKEFLFNPEAKHLINSKSVTSFQLPQKRLITQNLHNQKQQQKSQQNNRNYNHDENQQQEIQYNS